MKRFLLLLALVPAMAHSQGYPNRAVRMIVPFAPGGASDLVGRILQPRMSELLGQQVVVENRGGAAGNIGVEAGARSAPDGYTFVLGNIGSIAINPAVFPNLSVTPTRDLIAVTQVVDVPSALVAHPSFAPNNIKELIDYARANPGKLNYASTGNGTSNHLSFELFKTMTHTNVTHIPYKGSAPAVTDLIAGQVQVMFDNTPNVLPHVRAGKLKAIAVSTKKRSPYAPEVPTVDEAGVPGYDVSVWFGVLTVAGTPREIVNRLNTEMVRILTSAEVKERFSKLGVDVVAGSPEQFASFLKGEVDRWAKVIREAGIKAD